MRTEHLRQCLHKPMWDDASGATNWQKVVAIVQVAFRDRTLAKESTWQGLILIPKGGSGELRSIGLVEVIWKDIAILLYQRLTAAITFHYVLYVFWEGCGTGTVAIEYKLFQKFMAMR